MISNYLNFKETKLLNLKIRIYRNLFPIIEDPILIFNRLEKNNKYNNFNHKLKLMKQNKFID